MGSRISCIIKSTSFFFLRSPTQTQTITITTAWNPSVKSSCASSSSRRVVVLARCGSRDAFTIKAGGDVLQVQVYYYCIGWIAGNRPFHTSVSNLSVMVSEVMTDLTYPDVMTWIAD